MASQNTPSPKTRRLVDAAFLGAVRPFCLLKRLWGRSHRELHLQYNGGCLHLLTKTSRYSNDTKNNNTEVLGGIAHVGRDTSSILRKWNISNSPTFSGRLTACAPSSEGKAACLRGKHAPQGRVDNSVFDSTCWYCCSTTAGCCWYWWFYCHFIAILLPFFVVVAIFRIKARFAPVSQVHFTVLPILLCIESKSRSRRT